MKNTTVDGLLALTPQEIKIIYWRCRGETVEQTGKNVGLASSSVYKVLKEEIYPALHLEGWDDIKAEVCRPLLTVVSRVEDLNKWPEGYREKLEALRDPVEPQIQPSIPVEAPTTSQPTLSSQPQSQTDTMSSSTLPSGSESRPVEDDTRQVSPRTRFPWFLVAISIFLACLVCISGTLFIWRNRPLPQATQSPTFQLPTDTVAPPPATITPLPSNTAPVATGTSLPTTTHTPLPPTSTGTPTATLQPTLSPTSSVSALFRDDFNGGRSPLWQVVLGSEPTIVNDALNFNDMALMIIESDEWTDYEVHFWVSNMQCQQFVGSRGLTIGVRVQDANNMVALRLNDQDDCAATWMIRENSDWREAQNSTFRLPPVDASGGRTLVVRVQGNEFSSPIGTSVVIENFPTGGIAFMGNQAVIIDSVAVIPILP